MKDFTDLHPQVNVLLCYAPFYYEHLVFQNYHQKLHCKYFIDAVLGFLKSSDKELMQTLAITNDISNTFVVKLPMSLN